jgi:hypothetical protein
MGLGLIVAAVVVGGLFYQASFHFGLAIHLEGSTRKSITVKSEESPDEPKAYIPNSPPPDRLPIEYGVYSFRIEFKDGTVAWATYHHSDAGIRRRVDITIERLQGDRVRIRTVANGIRVLSEVTASSKDTSEVSPMVLDSI